MHSILLSRLSPCLSLLRPGIIENDRLQSNKLAILLGVVTNKTTVTTAFESVDRCVGTAEWRLKIMRGDTRIGQRRPSTFNAICDGPFAHILIRRYLLSTRTRVTRRTTSSTTPGKSFSLSSLRPESAWNFARFQKGT